METDSPIPCDLANSISQIVTKNNSQRQRRKNMKRKAMKRGKDKRVFTQTANAVKKINVKPKISRGGIRL